MNALKTMPALFVIACTSATITPPTIYPTITISAPASGATVTMGTDADKTVPITFGVSDFTLMAAGTCNGAANCGHVHILVDGPTCSPPPYNNEAHAIPTANALLAKCPTPAGSHTVTLELHDDMHNPVKDASGTQIAASVTFTAK
jgi:hypothetical protein